MFNGNILGAYPEPSAALMDFFRKLYSRVGSASVDLEAEVAANMVPVSLVQNLAKQAGLMIESYK